MTGLSMRELAERSGVNVQRLRQLVDLGILSPDAAGRFQPADIQRVRIIQALDRAGIAPAQIGQLIAAGAYSLDWAQVLFPDPTPQVATTLQQAAGELGLPQSLVAGLYAAWELAPARNPSSRFEPTTPSCCAWPCWATRPSGTTRPSPLASPGSLGRACDAWPNPRSCCFGQVGG
jgi:DNA-binding transcriptional MerR regulator